MNPLKTNHHGEGFISRAFQVLNGEFDTAFINVAFSPYPLIIDFKECIVITALPLERRHMIEAWPIPLVVSMVPFSDKSSCIARSF